MIFSHNKPDKGCFYHGKARMPSDIKCNDDSVPNAYALHCIWIVIALIFLIILLQIFHIRIVDNSIAMPAGLGAIAVLLVAEAFGFFISLRSPWLKYIIVFLVVITVTVVSVFLTYHTLLASVVPLLIAAQYSQRRFIYFAYALSVISIFVTVILGYQYGLCDANMVIQTVSTNSAYCGFLSAEILPFSERWVSIILFFAIPRCLLITVFVPMINAIVTNRKEILNRDVAIKYIGEHDHMTGFYNREKYAEMLNDSYMKLDKVAVLFFDLNNLKLTNDTYGHDVGDDLIKRAAASIRCAVGEDMDAYRLGGDEFMVAIPNGDILEAEATLEKWQDKLRLFNSLPNTMECSIAYGYAAGNGNNFPDILKQADKNMYDNKLKTKSHRIL